MKHQHDKSIEFLKWFYPEGPWNIVAISPTKKGKDKVLADTFAPGDEDAMLAFLNKHKKRNIYFTVNPIRSALKKKPERKDIAAMAWLHVDVDPRPREPLADEQTRIKGVMEEHRPRPSCVVFSGGGYQAFWRLNAPLPINGEEARYEDAKLYNKQLELLFDADHCHNVDRIMRVPGTVNWPDEKKKKRGREPALAYVVNQSSASYDLSQFTKAAQLQQGGSSTPRRTVSAPGNVQRLSNLDAVKVSPDCKVVITTGEDPDDPTRWASRSESLWWVVCEMVRAGVDDDTIFAIITDADWLISGHVLDQSRPEEYALRQIERAHEEAVAPELREMNDRFAIVRVSGKTRVLCEEPHGGVSLMTAGDLDLYFANKFVSFQAGTKEVQLPLSKWWLSHPMRRSYDRIDFCPGQTTADTYNLWRGYAVEAIPGDCSPFLDHVHENLCSGNDEWFNYLIGWMAHTVQYPDQPGHTAVVLRGKQGTGKSFFAHTIGHLFGHHYLPVSNAAHVFGNFNYQLQQCVVLFADEAFWAGDARQKSVLKALVTESHMVIERKGYDAERGRNCVHLIMASNERWVVPLEGQDRRFFVLDVNDRHMRDSDYFGKISGYMTKNGGYQALLHHLLTHDLSSYDVRNIPENEARSAQRALTMTGPEEWWFGKLDDGRLYKDKNEWPSRTWVLELLDDLVTHMRMYDKNYRTTPTQFGMFMREVLGGSRRAQSSGEHTICLSDGTQQQIMRPYFYVMPTLETCRTIWEAAYGSVAWSKPNVQDIEPDKNIEDSIL